jgi:uncharacterized protein YfiM (DUF2279 family)
MEKLRLMIFLLILLASSMANGQVKSETAYPDSIDKSELRKVILTESVSYAAGLSFLHFIWYKDTDRVPFHYYDDSKGYLQLDKGGHAFTAYRESAAAYRALRSAGVSKKKALLFGGPIGLVFQTPIEIFDGLYEGWGFSWSDMIANTFGSALFMAQEVAFDQQILLMKFSYSPSPYAAYYPPLGDTPVEQFFYDYNGHTYWLSANINSIVENSWVPDWLNVAVGYSGNGMLKEFENPSTYRGEALPEFIRHRQYILSLDIDFSRIHTDRKWLKMILRAANLIKVPFPALEYNKIEGVVFRPLYF